MSVEVEVSRLVLEDVESILDPTRAGTNLLQMIVPPSGIMRVRPRGTGEVRRMPS